MSDGKPNDRLAAQKLPASTAGDARVIAVEPGASGWKLTRRSVLSAAFAALAARVAAQVCANTYAHTDSVTAVALGSDGYTLLTGSADKTIKCWRVPPGGYYRTINAQASVQALAASPTQVFSGSSADSNVRVWSFDGVLQKTLSGITGGRNYGAVTALATTADGRLLVIGTNGGWIRVCRLPDGVFLNSQAYHTGLVRRVAVTADGELAVSAGQDGTVLIWELPSGVPLMRITASAEVTGLAVSPNDRMVASGGSDGSIKLWSLPYPRLLSTLIGHSGSVSALAFSADGRVLISGGDDKTIRSWNAADGTATGVQTAAHTDILTAIGLTRDGQLISASKDKSVKLWNTANGLAFAMCMIDLAANGSSVTGSKYTLDGVTYTVPCGTALPAGAVCSCNCVPGSACSCVAYSPCSCVCVLYGICTCNPQSCSCIGNWF